MPGGLLQILEGKNRKDLDDCSDDCPLRDQSLTIPSPHCAAAREPPHQTVGLHAQLELLPAVGAVPLGPPRRQIVQADAGKVEPLLFARSLVVTGDHRAPADVVAHAVARLGRIWLLFIHLSCKRQRSHACGSGCRRVWLG
jgi:hypothetical protein